MIQRRAIFSYVCNPQSLENDCMDAKKTFDYQTLNLDSMYYLLTYEKFSNPIAKISNETQNKTKQLQSGMQH